MLPLVSQDNPLAIIDDDASVRDALSLLFKIEDFSARAFGAGDFFLEALRPSPRLASFSISTFRAA